ncbi:MAG: dynamin family protein, partial [Sciscionella sp.]
DLFCDAELDLAQHLRNLLLERLDSFGIRAALALLRAEPACSTSRLRAELARCSGMAELRGRLHAVFGARADGIKAAAGLASLAELAAELGDGAARQRINDAITALLARPQAHQLLVLAALTLVTSGELELSAELRAEVLRVGGSTDPGTALGMPEASSTELAGHALTRASWWRSFAGMGASPKQARVGEAIHRAYFLLWQRLEEQ